MIDLHAHVLPLRGDGPASWGESLQMCRLAAADGIRRLVATPEFTGRDGDGPLEAPHRAVDQLRRRCKTGGTGKLEILFGASCVLHDGLVSKLEGGRLPMLAGSRYFLLVLPSKLPADLEQRIFDMCMADVVPIISGPESNPKVAENPEILHALLRSGAYAHVTAASLTGAFGPKTRRVARELVRCRLVQMIASDARDATHRPPVLSRARRAAAALLDADLADRMVNDVPAAVLADEPVRFPHPLLPKRSPWRGIHVPFRG